VFVPEGPGLAALESPELAEVVAELLAHYDPAYRPPPDLSGPFDPARDHLLVIFEDGRAYLYRLDGTPNQTRPLLTVVPTAADANPHEATTYADVPTLS
jgi:hypothetical protein